tara:strand:+ start:7361 stop:7939 length:579 start_codon:yes stop_codon:yes gene_type:complete
MNLDITKYKYTKNWFLISEIKQNLNKHINFNNKMSILEIGSFEGLSACGFSDNCLNHPESILYCVDPFFDSNTNLTTSKFVNDEVKKKFLYNISTSINSKKITFKNEASEIFFKSNDIFFDLIYIDGNHEITYILKDLENSFNILNINGIIWMDDYNSSLQIKNTIDNYLNKIKNNIKIIHKNYQIAFKKLN